MLMLAFPDKLFVLNVFKEQFVKSKILTNQTSCWSIGWRSYLCLKSCLFQSEKESKLSTIIYLHLIEVWSLTPGIPCRFAWPFPRGHPIGNWNLSSQHCLCNRRSLRKDLLILKCQTPTDTTLPILHNTSRQVAFQIPSFHCRVSTMRFTTKTLL